VWLVVFCVVVVVCVWCVCVCLVLGCGIMGGVVVGVCCVLTWERSVWMGLLDDMFNIRM